MPKIIQHNDTAYFKDQFGQLWTAESLSYLTSPDTARTPPAFLYTTLRNNKQWTYRNPHGRYINPDQLTSIIESHYRALAQQGITDPTILLPNLQTTVKWAGKKFSRLRGSFGPIVAFCDDISGQLSAGQPVQCELHANHGSNGNPPRKNGLYATNVRPLEEQAEAYTPSDSKNAGAGI